MIKRYHTLPTHSLPHVGLIEVQIFPHLSAPALLLTVRFFNCPNGPGPTTGVAQPMTGVAPQRVATD